ncbi:MAG: shikimate dehydrogenase [Bacteroidetes bacterium]|nr:shikimate dehydrogenase [Bacteroidota bacterium]
MTTYSSETRSFHSFVHSIDSKKPHYFVVGQSVIHSLSPVMHNIALRHHGLDAVYFAMDLRSPDIPRFASWINKDAFLGCNITIPFKRDLISIPDKLSPEAEVLGAINTIVKEKSGSVIHGYNTDIYGFIQPLIEFDDDLSYERAIVFGTGGASLAVQYALTDLGYEEIVLVSRTPHRAQPLVHAQHTTVVGYSQWQAYADEADLIVNTTPLGMSPKLDQSPVEEKDAVFLEDTLCYDLIYNPAKTVFLRTAELAGASTMNGLDMLIHQGSRSFELWTGHKFPISKIKQELITLLGE